MCVLVVLTFSSATLCEGYGRLIRCVLKSMTAVLMLACPGGGFLQTILHLLGHICANCDLHCGCFCLRNSTIWSWQAHRTKNGEDGCQLCRCVCVFCPVLCAYLSLKCHLSQAEIFFSLWIFLGKVVNFKRVEIRLNVCSQNSFVRSMRSQKLALGIFGVPLQYVHYDGGRLSAGLSDPPESESRDLACWHTGGAEALPP